MESDERVQARNASVTACREIEYTNGDHSTVNTNPNDDNGADTRT